MIRFESVFKQYGAKKVLCDLSFTLPQKGVVALMGPSGVGKTTILRLLAGLERPDGGTLVNTFEKTAVCFQEPRLIPWMSCKQNLTFVLQNTPESDQIAGDMLRLLELAEVEDALPDTLSGGMKQRVSLARALAARADLLLLDEPFTGLDEALKERLYPVVRSANEHGLTIIVTHNIDEAKALGATVLYLQGDPVQALLSE